MSLTESAVRYSNVAWKVTDALQCEFPFTSCHHYSQVDESTVCVLLHEVVTERRHRTINLIYVSVAVMNVFWICFPPLGYFRTFFPHEKAWWRKEAHGHLKWTGNTGTNGKKKSYWNRLCSLYISNMRSFSVVLAEKVLLMLFSLYLM